MMLCGWAAAPALAQDTALANGRPLAKAGARSHDSASATDATLSRAIGACLARESPACAAPWLVELEKRAAGSFTLRYAQGHVDFLAGRFARAERGLQRVAMSPIAPGALRPEAARIAAAAKASAAATQGFVQHTVAGGRFIIWVEPGPDEVLVPLLDHVLSRAAAALFKHLSPLPEAPIAVHVYPKVETLALVSGLTVAQVRTSGTIALCKHNRLMITSPRDLFFGYHWADTIAHELVHYLIMKRGGPDVPVWLHEALARTLESTWRDPSPPSLDDDERAMLALARRKNRFIPLRKMHPTMAALPSQEAAQIAFAEVHHALIWLLARARARDPNARFDGLLATVHGGTPALAAVQQWSGVAKFPGQWWAELRRGLEPNGGRPRSPAPTAQRGVRQQLRFRRAAQRSGERLGETAARHVELGDRLLAVNRPLAAVLEYRKAQAAGAQDDALMLARLARGLLQLRRHAEAKIVLDDAVSRHRNHAPLLLLLGQAAEAQGDHDGALHWAREAMWLNPFDPALHELRATALEATGQPALAAAARLQGTRVAN